MEEEIIWLIDDLEYRRPTNWFSKGYIKDQGLVENEYPAPFNQEFYLIINLAVGGNFSGYPNKETNFPTSFIIDSVKVYN